MNKTLAILFLLLGGCYATSPSEPPACLGVDLTPVGDEPTFDLTVYASTCAGLCNFSRHFEPRCANAADLCPFPPDAVIPQHVRDACGERIRDATSAAELELLIASCYCEDPS